MQESFEKKGVNTVEDRMGNYQQILEEVRSIYNDFFLNSEEMRQVFDEKYKDAGVVQLLDEKGQAIMGFDNKRIQPVEFEKIDDHSKEMQIRGILYSYMVNPIDLVEKLSKETALLEVIDRKGGNLKKLIGKNLEK